MTLAEDFKKAPKQTTATCKVCHLLINLGDEDKAALEAAMSDTSVAHTAVADILTRNGHSTSESSVRRHRKNHL